MYRFLICIALSVLLPYAFVEAQSSTAVRRCFHFTWLGPRFNNESEFLNATCQDATRLASGVPCVLPLVASYDGTWPDVDYIWRNHANEASCLGNSDVCATYTYYFDGKVENSTYLCARAVDGDGNAITSGCYTQRNGSFATQACFCQSVPGGRPCNNAVSTTVSMAAFVLSVALMLNKEIVVLWRNII